MRDELNKVGYRHPPVHCRFQPGHSGNPKGRPIKDKRRREYGEIDVASVLNETVPIQEAGGGIMQMTAWEGSVRKLLFWALTEGRLAPALEFLRLCKKSNAVTPRSPKGPGTGVVVVPGHFEVAPGKYEGSRSANAETNQQTDGSRIESAKPKVRRARRKSTPRTQLRRGIMWELCRETYPVRENGKRKRRQAIDLILQIVRTHAMKGNIRAVRMLDDMLEHYDQQ